MLYEVARPVRGIGTTLERGESMLPEGQKMSPELELALSELPLQMELPASGLFTTWADRADDFSWVPRTTPPSYNLRFYALKPEEISIAQQKLHNQPLPFIGAISPTPMLGAEIEHALEGSDYRFYSAHAVYQQNDKNEPPAISYFYWLAMGPEGKSTKSMSSVESLLKSQLVLPARVPYADTATRAFPAMPFNQAVNTELTEISKQDLLEFGEPVEEEPAEAGVPVLPMILFGAAAAAATVYLLRRSR